MAKKAGDGIQYVVGVKSKEPNQIIEGWQNERWEEAFFALKADPPVGANVKEAIFQATKEFVDHATSVYLAPAAAVRKELEKWQRQTETLRIKIWSTPHTTNPIKQQEIDALKLSYISKSVFRKKLSKKLKAINGHERQLLACVAIGIDASLILCSYAIQEIESVRKKNDGVRTRGTKHHHLWSVWVALIHSILKQNEVVFKLKNFGEFIAVLQTNAKFLEPQYLKRTGPKIGANPGGHIPTRTFGDSLEKGIRSARKFSEGADPKTLKKLLVYWARYDRVQRSKNRKLLSLLRKEDLLHLRRKPPLKGRLRENQ